MSTRSVPAAAGSHTFDDNTQAFVLERSGNKDIFYTVTDPDYGSPKRTLVYFHNAGEFSELLKPQIEQWTDAGYRVVTFDMPGSGLSYRDSQVGSEDLLHMDSFQDATQAARDVIDAVRDDFEFRPENEIHFVAAGTGIYSALDAVDEMAAGQVASITSISPPIEMNHVLWPDGVDRFVRNLGRDSADSDGYFEAYGLRDDVTGERVEQAEAIFVQAHPDRASGPLSVQYVSEMFESAAVLEGSFLDADWIHSSDTLNPDDITEALDRNDIPLRVIVDTDQPYMRGEDAISWGRGLEGISIEVADLRGGGLDPHFDSERLPTVTAEIEATVESGSEYVDIINNLRTVYRVEWNELPAAERALMQRNLESMGYDIGVHRDDAVPRHGGASDTEHALAQFIIDQCVDPSAISYDQDSLSALVQGATDAGFSKPEDDPMTTIDHVNVPGRQGTSVCIKP